MLQPLPRRILANVHIRRVAY